jgi:hypothetical protein
MKKIQYLFIVMAVLFLAGCQKEDGFVKIDSVSKVGNEFFQGQKIQVWVAAEIGDLKNAKYFWECDGGSFSGPKNLFQNVWVAPRKAGEYTVTCTVECNGESDTRSTKMTVGDYFFDKFSVASTNFSLSNFNATYSNGEVLLVGSKSNTRGSFRREFGDTALFNPFTYKADVAWRVKYKNATSSMYYRLQFNKPIRYNGTKVKKYIREIRLEIWPTATGTNKNYSLSYEVFSSEFSTSTWVTGENGRKDQFVFADGSKAADKKGMRPISISVDKDGKIIVKLDGASVLESEIVKTWRTTNAITDKLNLKSVWVEVYEQSNFYMDNVALTMD